MRIETLRCPDAVSKRCWLTEILILGWYLAKVTKIHANHHMRKCPSQQHSESPLHSPKCPTSKITHLCQLEKSCSCHQDLDQPQCPAKELDAEISKGYSSSCIIFVAVNIIVFSDPKPLVWNFSSARAELCPSFAALPSWHHTPVMGRAPVTARVKQLQRIATHYPHLMHTRVTAWIRSGSKEILVSVVLFMLNLGWTTARATALLHSWQDLIWAGRTSVPH